MSLSAALRLTAPSPVATSRKAASATGEGTRPFQQEPKYIDLSRMLLQYQHIILLIPRTATDVDDGLTRLQRQIQADLWSPLSYHRTKWLHNIEGARDLLLQLERAAQHIRIQRSKQNALKDLSEKRVVIKKLRNRIEEIGREIEAMGDDAYDLPQAVEGRESAMDILRQRKRETVGHSESSEQLENGRPARYEEEIEDGMVQEDTSRTELFNTSSAIRRRGEQKSDQPSDVGQTTGYSGLDPSERAMLDASRTQEDLSTSLVSMAAQLKQQARAFQFSLDKDKGILDRALEGLDRNLSGMEAASKKMQFLKRMSEGEGWWGRMKLYALIFGMWVAAVLLVFVMPKLRF